MKKQYIIVDNKKNEHVRKCFFDVLDIEDRRAPVNNDSIFDDETILLIHEISIEFLGQLTEQISGKILRVLNRKMDKKSFLCLRDRYIVEINNMKYIWITLFWNNSIGEVDLWVKFWSENGSAELTNDSDLVFEISNRKESQMCDTIRFGEEFRYWVDQIHVNFELFSKNEQEENKKAYPSNYPDVTINCHFDKIVNHTIKQQVYTSLNNYISNLNFNLQDEFKIHDFFLIDSISNEVISVFVDFGNCEPAILDELLQYLLKLKLGIIEFSFN